MFNPGDVVQVKKEFMKEYMKDDPIGIVINKREENIYVILRAGVGEMIIQERTFELHELEPSDEYISTEEFMVMVRSRYKSGVDDALFVEMFWDKVEIQNKAKKQCMDCESTEKIIDRLEMGIKNKIEEVLSNPEFKEDFEYILGEDWNAEQLNTFMVRDCINMIQSRLVMD